MEQVYRMLFDEVRRALNELRGERRLEALRTLEGVVLMDEFIRHYRRRDPHALHLAEIVRCLEWERTPEGRLEWQRVADAERRWQLELQHRL